jgi:hypothetical protein
VHRSGAGKCRRGIGGDNSHRGGAPRTLEEEEAGFLQFEVSGTLPRRP